MRTKLLIALLCGVIGVQAQQLAFPGAEGFGAYASGGRGGQVVHVTNLNAAGAGSLAEAVSQPNRFVVFDVGGIIDITGKNITIASNVTIAGQTAPGEGITIYGGRVIASKSTNVIIRYIRMRGGSSVDSKKCTLTLDECDNVIMDHCSVSWGPWDNVHIANANNITWQNCIISEGIEPQRFGAITDGTRNWTIHHCLWQNNKSRNPKMKCYVQYYNNVVYNYTNGVVGGHSAADNYQDLMNNYFIAGPNGSAKYFDQWTETDHMYSTGNYFDGNCDGVLNGTLVTDHHSATPMQNPSLKCSAPMNLETAAQAYESVVEHVGASRVRDVHDKRIIDQLTSLGKKGAFIDNEQNVGGIGTVAGGPKITDADNDGMADEWEEANGLNPAKNDANDYTLDNGYTNIENYVNSLAQKSNYLMYPLNVVAKLADESTVELTWSNDAEGVTAIVLEQSEDGKVFTEIQRLDGEATRATVTGLTPQKVYYFRLKNLSDAMESLYSGTVSVNNEFMRGGGGVEAGTDPFVSAEGKLYRIICYGTVPFNSSTTINGIPKYLTFNDNGSLGSTEEFLWDNPALLWEITPTEGGFHIRNYSTKSYMTAQNVTIGSGDARIGSTEEPVVLTINYTSDHAPAQSGLNTPVAMYRINCPSNKNMQIRARGFVDDWVWGSGTIERADMIFTFAEIDASLVRLYLTKFNNTLESAELLAKGASTDVTLGYPTEALNTLMNTIVEAQAFSDNISENCTQAEVDSVVAVINNAVSAFEATRIYTLTDFSTTMAYNIYTYGTTSNASASSAASNIERRYLCSTKSVDGLRDSLVYRIGLSDNSINAGNTDPIAADDEALWILSKGEGGYVYVQNRASGAYMQIEQLLSAEPVAIYPYYAKTDNGKLAFFLDASEAANRCIQIGSTDASLKEGPLTFFAGHADRTRMRWVFEETEEEAVTSIPSTLVDKVPGMTVGYYNLQGVRLAEEPASGIFIEVLVEENGSVVSRKMMAE